MAIRLNHTIVAACDNKTAAKFLTDILGLPPPSLVKHFAVVRVSDDTSLDYMDTDEVAPQHYAFLVDESEFDEIFERIRERGLTYWADPRRQERGQINTGTAGAESTLTIQTAICWRSSPARTAAVARPRPGLTPCSHKQRVPKVTRAAALVLVNKKRPRTAPPLRNDPITMLQWRRHVGLNGLDPG